jgi:hypothetical protein
MTVLLVLLGVAAYVLIRRTPPESVKKIPPRVPYAPPHNCHTFYDRYYQ